MHRGGECVLWVFCGWVAVNECPFSFLPLCTLSCRFFCLLWPTQPVGRPCIQVKPLPLSCSVHLPGDPRELIRTTGSWEGRIQGVISDRRLGCAAIWAHVQAGMCRTVSKCSS